MTTRGDESRTAISQTHVETAVAAIARLHAEHHQRATPFQRFTEGLTARVGHTNFVIWLTTVVVGWIIINFLIRLNGLQPLDGPPFVWLELVVSLAALYMTALILSTQRRDDELARHREHLTLELAILSDLKSAKIVELLEELRRDHPDLHDRVDHDAHLMSTPTDPQTVIDAIKASQEEMLSKPTP